MRDLPAVYIRFFFEYHSSFLYCESKRYATHSAHKAHLFNKKTSERTKKKKRTQLSDSDIVQNTYSVQMWHGNKIAVAHNIGQ